METGGNYIVQNEDYLTKFTINDCERKHTGIYKIHAKNDSGSDEADLEIVVLGESQLLTSQLLPHKTLNCSSINLKLLFHMFNFLVAKLDQK